MKLDVQFETEPLLLVVDNSFTNKSMLNGSRLLFFGNQTPAYTDEEDKEDKRLNWLCDQICEVLEHEDVPFMVVQQNLLSPSYKNSGIRLVSHTRLSKNEKLNQLPIIILTDRANDQLFPKSQLGWEELAPLYSKGVRFTPENDKERRYAKNDSLLIQEIEKLYGTLTRDGKNEVDVLEFKDPDKPVIPTSKPEGSNHQLTNDWGAYRLIQAAGLTPAHEYRKHLYFKYLQQSSKEPSPADKELFKDRINLNPNILLIDDNYQKGWKNSIEEIFNKCLLNEGCKVTVNPLEYADSVLLLLDEENGKREIDKYDIVYLDLRLPKNENNRSNPLSEQGIRVLNAIKKINPTIPIIMFTASTKATNMDDLYELGADGYFVKEFPETRIDADFSKKNLEGFIKTTRNCLQKGILLRPYWKRIQSIKTNNLIRGCERIIDGNQTKFEQRIIERLTMFVGLLKKAYEQTVFDQNTFFYDQYETAFLTLWSCLNEILEAYFEKKQESGEEVWTLVNQNPKIIFLHKVGYNGFCIYEITTPALTVKERSRENIVNILTRDPKYKADYQNNTQIQVAFLIDKSTVIRDAFYTGLSKRNATLYDLNTALGKNMFDKEWDKVKKNFLPIINKSNFKRNKLNLTHASDSRADYVRTARESKEKVNNEEINNLFKAVLLLITGDFPGKI